MTATDKDRVGKIAAQEADQLRTIWAMRRGDLPSQAEFGELYGIGGQSAVANFLHGRSLLSMKAGLGFARGLGVALDAFSPRLAAEAKSISEAFHVAGKSADPDRAPPSVDMHPIPVLGDLVQTPEGALTQTSNTGQQIEDLAVVQTGDRDAYAMRIVGDMFFPRYRAGEFLVLSMSAEKLAGTDVLVQIELGGLVLRQWAWQRDSYVQLLPVGDIGTPITVPIENVAWAHRVIGSVGPDAKSRKVLTR